MTWNTGALGIAFIAGLWIGCVVSWDVAYYLASIRKDRDDE